MNLRRTALTLALLLVPAVASAQLSDADKATARALAQQGQDALEKKDFTTAADPTASERARQLFPAPTLAVGLARAQVGLGRWIAAQETFNRILREGAPAGSPPAYAKAVAEARKRPRRPRAPDPQRHHQREGSGLAQKVTIDGVAVPSAALGVNRLVDPGAHTVRAEAEGFAPAQARVSVAERTGRDGHRSPSSPGSRGASSLRLRREPPRPAAWLHLRLLRPRLLRPSRLPPPALRRDPAALASGGIAPQDGRLRGDRRGRGGSHRRRGGRGAWRSPSTTISRAPVRAGTCPPDPAIRN